MSLKGLDNLRKGAKIQGEHIHDLTPIELHKWHAWPHSIWIPHDMHDLTPYELHKWYAWPQFVWIAQMKSSALHPKSSQRVCGLRTS